MAMEVLRLELKSKFININESLIHKVSESKKKHDLSFSKVGLRFDFVN